MGEAIVITSGKGGVGKSTTTANVGIALADLGKKVILVDTDIGLRNLDVILGMENSIVYDLVDVIKDESLYEKALQDWGLDGFKLDFIDSFELSGKSLEADPRRDYTALDEAVDVLMTDVMKALTALKPDTVPKEVPL